MSRTEFLWRRFLKELSLVASFISALSGVWCVNGNDVPNTSVRWALTAFIFFVAAIIVAPTGWELKDGQ